MPNGYLASGAGAAVGVGRETEDGDTDRATLIRDLLEGQYDNPVRVVAFNTAEGWSRDVSEDIANDLQDVWSDRGELSALWCLAVGHYRHGQDTECYAKI
jgi:hypothetical protein